jgi:hypothetical protein
MRVTFPTRSPGIAAGTTRSRPRTAQYHPYNLPTYGTTGAHISDSGSGSLGSKLAEEAPVVGSDEFLNEAPEVVKPEEIH